MVVSYLCALLFAFPLRPRHLLVTMSLIQTGASLAVGGILIARAIYRRRLRSKRYPQARRSDHTDEYWGETVEDPYRWMEGMSQQEDEGYERHQWESLEVENLGTSATLDTCTGENGSDWLQIENLRCLWVWHTSILAF